MNLVKTNFMFLLIALFFNISWAQEVHSPMKTIAAVDMAALDLPTTIIKAAEQMPERYYTFRPTPEVRSFGELIAHIAESNLVMCALAKGEDSPMLDVVPTKTDALDALKKSFDYCVKTRKTMAKSRKEAFVQFMGRNHSAGNVLDFTIFHSLQHYGNLIVYMRLKGLVPPTSQLENEH